MTAWRASACARWLVGAATAGCLVAAAGCGGSSAADPPVPVAAAGDADAAPVPVPRPSLVEPEVGAPAVAVRPADAGFDAGTASSGGRAEQADAGRVRDPEAALAVPPAGSAPSPGAPTDAEVRRELLQLGVGTNRRAAILTPDGQAIAPLDAPEVVRQVIAAGNAIARTPYIWGGGHARVYDRGYDCSGSLSFAFINAGLLDTPRNSGFSTMGGAGPGRWISVYSNAGHVWMIVAGLRYDTSAIHIAGSRWTNQRRSLAGFTVRHPVGL